MLQNPTPIPEQKAPVIVKTLYIKKKYREPEEDCTKTVVLMVCDNVNVMNFIIHESLIKLDFSLEVSVILINLVLHESKDSVNQFLIFH